jgi:hypothetical protein
MISGRDHDPGSYALSFIGSVLNTTNRKAAVLFQVGSVYTGGAVAHVAAPCGSGIVRRGAPPVSVSIIIIESSVVMTIATCNS